MAGRSWPSDMEYVTYKGLRRIIFSRETLSISLSAISGSLYATSTVSVSAPESSSSWHPGSRTDSAGFVRLKDEVCLEEVGKWRNAPSASTGVAEVV
jgi:hypothetical protein